jgi:hypothetical protein
MIYKTVSVKSVIDKVLRDYEHGLENIRVTDMITWASEALNKIDAYPYYNIKATGFDGESLLVVSDYQTQLPSDLKEIISVKFSATQTGYFWPLRCGSSTFGSVGEVNTSTNTTTTTSPNTLLISTVMDLYSYTYAQAVTAINTDSVLREKISSLLKVQSSGYNAQLEGDDSSRDYVYYVVGDYLKLNVETGYIELAYKAKPTDSEGYPLVPDDESFMEALYWYIVMKLLYPEWLGGRIRDVVYFDARHNWNFYCKQAYGKAMMPSGDKLEALKNQWLRLFPEINTFDTSHATIGDKQVIYNH